MTNHLSQVTSNRLQGANSDDSLVSVLEVLRSKGFNLKDHLASSSELWFEMEDGSLNIVLRMDQSNQMILYDVFSPMYDAHFKEQSIRDIERLSLFAEEHRKWKLAKSIEDSWLALDWISLWARRQGLGLEQRRLV
jgi:hypothetical protein